MRQRLFGHGKQSRCARNHAVSNLVNHEFLLPGFADGCRPVAALWTPTAMAQVVPATLLGTLPCISPWRMSLPLSTARTAP